MVTSNCNSGYLTTQDVATLYGLSAPTVATMADNGDFSEVHKTSGGHRRISAQKAREYFLGINPADYSDGVDIKEVGSIVCYCRVSDVSQDKAGSLTRQIERMKQEVSAREGIPADSIPIYKDVASSFGNRENLNKLVDSIIEGKVKKIYCEYLDRLSRVPALTRLIEHLCEKFGVEIIAIDIEQCDDKDISQKELLGFLTVWCNKISAQKSRLVTLKTLEPATVETIITLRQKGLTVKAITKELEKLNHRTSKGDFVSYAKTRQVCDSNGNETILTKFLVNGEVENSIKDFAQSKIVKNEKSRISTKDIYSVYTNFCQAKGISAQPQNIFGKSLVKLLGKQNRRIEGVNYWQGYTLN